MAELAQLAVRETQDWPEPWTIPARTSSFNAAILAAAGTIAVTFTPEVPVLLVKTKPDERIGDALRSRAFLDAVTTPRPVAVKFIVDWLRDIPVAPLSLNERTQLEKLIGELTRLLSTTEFRNEDPDDVAQVQAAVDTMAAQLKAPRASRGVLRWAVSQIPGFMLGLLSNMGNDAIIHFSHFH